MARKRSPHAGMTDYTGVDLDNIFKHLCQWKDMTGEAISSLQELSWRVDEEASKLKNPEDVRTYIAHFSDSFQRYYEDFKRLVSELPSGVLDSHIEIISQIYMSSSSEEYLCRKFRD